MYFKIIKISSRVLMGLMFSITIAKKQHRIRSIFSEFYASDQACEKCIYIYKQNINERIDGIQAVPQKLYQRDYSGNIILRIHYVPNIAETQESSSLSFIILSEAFVFATVQDLNTEELFYIRTAILTIHPEKECIVLANNINLALLNNEQELIYPKFNPIIKDGGIIIHSALEISGTEKLAKLAIIETNKILATEDLTVWKALNTYAPRSPFLIKGGFIGISNNIENKCNDHKAIAQEHHIQNILSKMFRQLENKLKKF